MIRRCGGRLYIECNGKIYVLGVVPLFIVTVGGVFMESYLRAKR